MKQALYFPGANLYKEDYDCLFRDPRNEPYTTLSYHDFYEFQIFLGSAGLMRIGEHEYLVERGDLAFIDMFMPHELIINPKYEYERFSISIDASLLISMSTSQTNLLDLFHGNRGGNPVVHLEEEVFQKYVDMLKNYRHYTPRHGKDVMDKALIHVLLSFAYNDCYNDTMLDEKSSHYVSIISQLINYINTHLSEELSLPLLAEQVSYSEYYVCRIFKKMTGKNLSNYIQEKRIGEAARMLRENAPVGKAAEAVGFNNYSYFYKTFLRQTGLSPADYKKQFSSATPDTRSN